MSAKAVLPAVFARPRMPGGSVARRAVGGPPDGGAERAAVEGRLRGPGAAAARRVARRLAVLVARVGVGARLEEQGDDRVPRVRRRGVERRAAAVVAAGDVDAVAREQPFDRVGAPVRRGPVQRGVAEERLRRVLRSVGEQPRRRRQARAERRDVARLGGAHPRRDRLGVFELLRRLRRLGPPRRRVRTAVPASASASAAAALAAASSASSRGRRAAVAAVRRVVAFLFEGAALDERLKALVAQRDLDLLELRPRALVRRLHRDRRLIRRARALEVAEAPRGRADARVGLGPARPQLDGAPGVGEGGREVGERGEARRAV